MYFQKKKRRTCERVREELSQRVVTTHGPSSHEFLSASGPLTHGIRKIAPELGAASHILPVRNGAKRTSVAQGRLTGLERRWCDIPIPRSVLTCQWVKRCGWSSGCLGYTQCPLWWGQSTSCPADGTKIESDSHCSSLEKKGAWQPPRAPSLVELGPAPGTLSCYMCNLRALGLTSLLSPRGEWWKLQI